MSSQPRRALIEFKGQYLQQFLACANGKFCGFDVKLNDDLYVRVQFFPNGTTPRDNGFVELQFIPKMTANVDCCAFFVKTFCPYSITRASKSSFFRVNSQNNNQPIGKTMLCQRRKCENKGELTFKLYFYSLQINKKDNSIIGWPSKLQMFTETEVAWNISSTDFKQREASNGTIFSLGHNQWRITVHKEIYCYQREGLFLEFDCTQWPANVSMMYVSFKTRIILKKEKDEDTKQDDSLDESYRMLKLSKSGDVNTYNIEMHEVPWSEIVDNLIIEGIITIKNLYDRNGNEIDVKDWRRYNVFSK